MQKLSRIKILRVIYQYTGLRILYLSFKSFITYGFKHNCGGKNNDLSCFAGNLVKGNLSPSEYEKIYFDLIMINGTRKATTQERNKSVTETIIAQIGTSKHKNGLDILDIGSSNGIDAFNTYNAITPISEINKYLLADLFTELHYDKKSQLIFDQDGNLLQVLRKKNFVNINFQFTYAYQRWTNLYKYFLPYLLKRQIKYNENNVIKLSLLIPKIAKLIENKEVFSFERLNVFEPIPGNYDIIICIHLLNDFYFSENEISTAKNNLISTLKPGGFLVVGTAAKHEVIYA